MFSFRLTVFALLTMFIDFYILETTSNLTIKIIRPYMLIMIMVYGVIDDIL